MTPKIVRISLLQNNFTVPISSGLSVIFKINYPGPGRVAVSWLEHRPIHQKAVGLIPGQSTYLGCGFNPQSGHV